MRLFLLPAFLVTALGPPALAQETVDHSTASRVSPYPIRTFFPGACKRGDMMTYSPGTPGSDVYICGNSNDWNRATGTTAQNAYTDPAADVQDFLSNSSLAAIAGPFTGAFYGAIIDPRIGAANTQNWTGPVGLVGIALNPGINSGATGTLTNFDALAIGGSFTSTMNVTTYRAISAHRPVRTTGVLTNSIGIAVNQNDNGVNNTNLLLGTLTAPAGNWSLYSSSAYPSYVTGSITFAGGVQQPLTTPASSSAACTAGAIQWDAAYIYICTATDTWKRAALSAF